MIPLCARQPVPPTGRRVSVSGVDIGRFADGVGVEHWASMDRLGLLQQLGILESGRPTGPTEAAAGATSG
jgi:hypothetical protein